MDLKQFLTKKNDENGVSMPKTYATDALLLGTFSENPQKTGEFPIPKTRQQLKELADQKPEPESKAKFCSCGSDEWWHLKQDWRGMVLKCVVCESDELKSIDPSKVDRVFWDDSGARWRACTRVIDGLVRNGWSRG